jgi:diguanylate cyclase (GGDEF)-like protein
VPIDDVIDDVAAALRRGANVTDACQAALDALARYTGAMTAVLIRVREKLRCIAASGSWQVYLSVRPGDGVVGRVYNSGETAVVTDVTSDPDYISLGPTATVDICAPIRGTDGELIGAFNVEFTTDVDAEPWRAAIESMAEQIGVRISELGGPPTESRGEMLVRHGLALTTAATEAELAMLSLRAAREVSGLETPVLVLATTEGHEVIVDETNLSPLARRILKLPMEPLVALVERSHQHGSSYSIGDPDTHNTSGFDELTEVGICTLITVPVGAFSPLGGALLVADERVSRPDPESIALLSLLAAQAWSSRERIRTLANLHERALSDPLTGLRHQGSFGERLATATPGHTAVFAIDIDGFKSINDTYGHQAGDRALVALAQALTTALRAQDELFRIGGDEFAAVLEIQRSDEALFVAERLIIAARAVGHTISVGVAIRRNGELSEETLRRADTALYLAKREGRDAVRLAP